MAARFPKIAVVIVAAGRGSRFGGPLPKQYCLLKGQPVLRHTLAAFATHPAIRWVQTIIHPDDQALYQQSADGLNILPPVLGGSERQDSVRNGLEAISHLNPDVVLIHDAARPFISSALIDRIIAAFDDPDLMGVLPGIPVADTLKRVTDTVIQETVPRDGLWRAQTPQAFRFAPILEAHHAAVGQAFTDDVAVAEASGMVVKMVMGEEKNQKLTLPHDMGAQSDAVPPHASRETRVGSGFDVHAFVPGDQVTLCGIQIPHNQRLSGHSDADVALHALTDALYGAIGAGDIGFHFPPSDDRWKGCNSKVFLDHAVALVRAKGGRITHVDVTIICEAPKVGPHRQAMRMALAEAMGIESGRVSVKATTTEKLGFCGRAEGIAAQATATITLPGE